MDMNFLQFCEADLTFKFYLFDEPQLLGFGAKREKFFKMALDAWVEYRVNRLDAAIDRRLEGLLYRSTEEYIGYMKRAINSLSFIINQKPCKEN